MSFSPAGNQQANLPQSTVKFFRRTYTEAVKLGVDKGELDMVE